MEMEKVQGVCFDKRDNSWVSFWSEDGKERKKYFAVNKYPNAYDLACEHRAQQKYFEINTKPVVYACEQRLKLVYYDDQRNKKEKCFKTKRSGVEQAKTKLIAFATDNNFNDLIWK